ncbi:heat shock 70 kDa protein 12A-like [Mercenaria mercenaria]|uniref:heat shock 70 kDa protein 12A-like n=1 Tax=Mercenaria mercenaria TaxID=6596 RepID=UPI00234E85B2|nr:heat shock 70 kDa protein 12A-like [Mercenaria mercenaria]XP_053399446.1 heat shock 70 kDa protein 12A-like [Mercenaria mercenaria]
MSALLVAAIDFGTTYSGWAFSFEHEYERDPTKVFAKNWSGGQLVSQKGPTCVLIHPDGKRLHSFGYEAESKYGELALDKRHKQWFFFKRFKMSLYGRIGIERNIMLEDASGKKLTAKTVFALSIKYLKDDLIKMSEKRLAGAGIRNYSIHWVLTVPAIWNDAAKQFMREAAQDAGILKENLTIALEPEAASLFCRHLPVEKCLGREKISLSKFKAGTKYLVLDAGGGTVDITVHEVMSNGDLRELHKASGGAWGGTKVDDAFENFLTVVIGKKAVENFKQHHMEDYIDIFRDFEIKKRETAPSKDSKITIRVPVSLVEMAKKTNGKPMKQSISKSMFKEKLSLIGDKIRMEANVMKGFFYLPLKSILDHVGKLLSEPQIYGCSAIVMVGGFSESTILQEHIQNMFSDLKIVIPEEAGLAVLKGAVIFGHNPKMIAERVCKYTYGTDITHVASPMCKHHRKNTRPDEYGEMRCYGIFEKHAKIGQSIRIGEQQKECLSWPMYDDQTSVTYDIYASSSVDPVFVTDVGCSRIGTLTIPISDTSLGRERRFGVSFLFGGTEIEVKVVDKTTGEVTIKTVDFLG